MRNVLATEALNRMVRARRAIVTLATDLSEETLRLEGLVVDSVVAAREAEAWLPEEGRAERDGAREAALKHARSTGAVEALDRLCARAVALSDDALAHTREPDMFSV
jgi:hypothetical protein